MGSSNNNDKDIQNKKDESGSNWTATFEIEICHNKE